MFLEKSINNGIEIYFEYLNECNKIYNRLINISCIDNPLKLKKSYFNLVQNLNKIIPWYYVRKTNELKLASNDGILCFKNIFPKLKDELDEVFHIHFNVIDNIRNIRNAIEHAPHQIIISEMCSGSNLSFIECIRKDGKDPNKYIIKSIDLKLMIADINNVYINVLQEIKNNKKKYFGNNTDSYTFQYLNNYKLCKLG